MAWINLALTVFAGGLVASLTDWMFMGDWLYKRYNQYPEIWRYPHGQGEMKAIAWYTPLALRHLRGLHALVRSSESPLVQRDSQIGSRYLACRTFATAHRECAVY